MDVRLERAARALLEAWERDCDSPGPASWRALEVAFTDFRAALATPTPEGVPVSLLPLARALLRDANDAIDAAKGGMRPASPPRATVDANRLRNVAAAVVAHLTPSEPASAAGDAEREVHALLESEYRKGQEDMRRRVADLATAEPLPRDLILKLPVHGRAGRPA